jgi:hypothetical protein
LDSSLSLELRLQTAPLLTGSRWKVLLPPELEQAFPMLLVLAPEQARQP